MLEGHGALLAERDLLAFLVAHRNQGELRDFLAGLDSQLHTLLRTRAKLVGAES
jgi:hypothetical protein